MKYSLITHWKPCSAALLIVLTSFSNEGFGQNCPANIPTTISTNPDSYYPGLDATVNAGATSITLGTSSGPTPISSGDMLLVIQMQGAQINSTNTSSYGDGASGAGASGYLSNGAMIAGNMEYVVATNTVPLSGGTLSLAQGTVNRYKNSNFGADGQYRYQVIRVGIYYDLTLAATIAAPSWNGATGGVIVMSVTNQLNFNGQKITAAAAGFRGGAGRQLGGATGGSNADLVTMSTSNFNASKGEGIAGTPRFINNNGAIYDNGSANEGYPGGSYAAGAPGNAGGGGTDGNPSANDQNSGGGGGANGGVGGKGGNSWSSNLAVGGEPGAVFMERGPSKLVMGGGGGAGTTNNGTGTPGSGFASSGAAGGGIVLLTAGSISGAGTIDVSGADAYTTVVNDANGGGGAGGSVLLYAGSGLSHVTVLARGGKGGTNSGGGSPPPHGPGGGGGGGVVYSNATLNALSSTDGGSQGVTTGTITYGAVAGSTGTMVQNVTIQQLPAQNLDCSVLPIRIKSVEARQQDNQVVITWKVTNEAGVREYTVERSDDGKNFHSAGTVPFRYTPSDDNSYSFADTKTFAGTTAYYRIKETPVSGSVVYSSVVVVRADDAASADLSVSPNPVTASANIRFTLRSAPADDIRLRLMSVNGVTVWQKQYKASAGLNIVPIDNIASFPEGVYFMQYHNSQEVVNIKMIVSR